MKSGVFSLHNLLFVYNYTIMTEQQKAVLYGQLLNEHTRLGNKISEIKGQDIEMNQKQQGEIKMLQNQQVDIMNKIRKMLS